MDRLLKVREADIYFLLVTDTEEPEGSEATFMVDRRRRILDGTPYLGVPLEAML